MTVKYEKVAFLDIDGVWCIFHAMVPPTKKFRNEEREAKEEGVSISAFARSALVDRLIAAGA
ncbi:MAG: hypothetical protein U0L51_03530 [Olegusella sp.]|nr:hypothetical protein [Olegusella sp.]